MWVPRWLTLYLLGIRAAPPEPHPVLRAVVMLPIVLASLAALAMAVWLAAATAFTLAFGLRLE